MKEAAATVMLLASLVPLLIATPFLLKIEQRAGYDQYAQGGYRYVPTYRSVFLAAHINRARYTRCPACSKKS